MADMQPQHMRHRMSQFGDVLLAYVAILCSLALGRGSGAFVGTLSAGDMWLSRLFEARINVLMYDTCNCGSRAACHAQCATRRTHHFAIQVGF